MKGLSNHWHLLQAVLLGLGLAASVGLTGCQIESGGQTLPSPYYMSDDVQYFPPGQQFVLAKEAAAMKTYNETQTQQATTR
jgi:hypothetical protein